MTEIDHATACQIRDAIDGAYFGNSHDYGQGYMGYHVGGKTMIALQVPASRQPEWKEMTDAELKAHLNEVIAPLGLPITSYNPEFFGSEYQIYFWII